MANFLVSAAVGPSCYCNEVSTKAFVSGRLTPAANFACRITRDRKFLRAVEKGNLSCSKNGLYFLPFFGRKTFFSAPPGALLQQMETYSKTKTLERQSSYLFRTEFGSIVKVSVKEKSGKHVVSIEVSADELVAPEDELMLNWGAYRSNPACLMDFDSKNAYRESIFAQNLNGIYSTELELEGKWAPLYLSFQLKLASTKSIIKSSHKRENFCVPIGFDSGKPSPLGLSFPADKSINFAIFSKHHERVVLCLYGENSSDTPVLELDLDPVVNKTGDIWHVSLRNSAEKFSSYDYKFVDADDQVSILDPYAEIVLPTRRGFIKELDSFDWSDEHKPNLAMENLVVYRLNVERFTKDKSSGLSNSIAGTFEGVAEMVDHFKLLGVNAVLLEPIFPFDEKKGPYFSNSFFSPCSHYAPSKTSPVSAIDAMKKMVKELHRAGIELLLEIVFPRDDFSCNSPVSQRMILDSLHLWLTEFHVDGFCFTNAAFLLKGSDGENLARPPIVEAIAFDPLLADTKLIADCFDPQEMEQIPVVFPHWKRWAEVNSSFCYDVRNFLRGKSALSDLATRLCGSGDIFFNGRGPSFSFNYVSRNFGLPLVDLVSFSDAKLASEKSWNCGEEGPTTKTAVLERRLKQIRNFIFILFVSLGVPVLNMGDECGQSCGGSVSYHDRKNLDWSMLQSGFGVQTMQFISFLTSLRRRRSDLFQKNRFSSEEMIDWYGADLSPPKWEDPASRFLAVTLKSESESGDSGAKGDVFMAFNLGSRTESVVFPAAAEGFAWRRVVDTSLPFPDFFCRDGEALVEETVTMKPYSCVFLEAFCVTK